MVYFTFFRQTGTHIAVRSSGLHCQVDLCVTVRIAFLLNPVYRNECPIPYNLPGFFLVVVGLFGSGMGVTLVGCFVRGWDRVWYMYLFSCLGRLQAELDSSGGLFLSNRVIVY